MRFERAASSDASDALDAIFSSSSSSVLSPVSTMGRLYTRHTRHARCLRRFDPGHGRLTGLPYAATNARTYNFTLGPAAQSRGSAVPAAPDAQTSRSNVALARRMTRIHAKRPANRPATDQRWIGASVPERTRSMRLLRLMQLKWDYVWFDASSVRGGMTGNNTRACQGWRVTSPALARTAAQPLASARSDRPAWRPAQTFHLSKRASVKRAR